MTMSPIDYCGFACSQDVFTDTWQSEVSRLAARVPAELGIGGWAQHWSRIWEYPRIHRDLNCFFGDRTGKVLDSGCGMTPSPVWSSQQGHEVHGVDLDDSGAPGWMTFGNFHKANMEALPFDTASFDAAYSVSALEHVERPITAVEELCRVTRPGGLVALTCDVDIHNSHGLSQECLDEMQRLLLQRTVSLWAWRSVSPGHVISFDNMRSRDRRFRNVVGDMLRVSGLRPHRQFCIWHYAGLRAT